MEYILAAFECGEVKEDLKVPGFISVGDLIDIFAELYGTDAKMLHAEPKGIILDKNKTLAEQGVEHGAKLTLS